MCNKMIQVVQAVSCCCVRCSSSACTTACTFLGWAAVVGTKNPLLTRSKLTKTCHGMPVECQVHLLDKRSWLIQRLVASSSSQQLLNIHQLYFRKPCKIYVVIFTMKLLNVWTFTSTCKTIPLSHVQTTNKQQQHAHSCTLYDTTILQCILADPAAGSEQFQSTTAWHCIHAERPEQ